MGGTYKSTEAIDQLVWQNVRIHEALDRAALPAELIYNDHGEPLAVLSRGLLEVTEGTYGPMVPVYPAGIEWETASESKLGDTIPLSGLYTYGPKLLSAMDIVVRSAVGYEGLATRLGSSLATDEIAVTVTDSGLHVDSVSKTAAAENVLYGLNVHVNRIGNYTVCLGGLRELRHNDALEVHKRQAGYISMSVRASIYEQFAGPMVTSGVIEPGDVLIFQGAQHTKRGVPAVAHNFQTTSAQRRSDVFRPYLGPQAVVAAARAAAIRQYPELSALGYAA